MKKIYPWVWMFLIAVAGCASDRPKVDRAYLDSRLVNPVVYPENLDAPKQERVYTVPSLPTASSQDPDSLIVPPRLEGVEVDLEDESESATDDAEEGGN